MLTHLVQQLDLLFYLLPQLCIQKLLQLRVTDGDRPPVCALCTKHFGSPAHHGSLAGFMGTSRGGEHGAPTHDGRSDGGPGALSRSRFSCPNSGEGESCVLVSGIVARLAQTLTKESRIQAQTRDATCPCCVAWASRPILVLPRGPGGGPTFFPKRTTSRLMRSTTPAKRSPDPMGQFMGKAASPNSASSSSIISSGSIAGRSSLLTNVKMGSFLGHRRRRCKECAACRQASQGRPAGNRSSSSREVCWASSQRHLSGFPPRN